MHATKVLYLTALAASTVLANSKPIIDAMNAVKSSTTQLGNTVSAFTGDILGMIPIAVESLALIEDIKKGSKTAEASAPLTLAEAVDVGKATQGLAAEVNKTLEAVIAAKPKFDHLIFVSPVTYFNLEQQKKATDDLSGKILAKVPEEAQDIAQAIMQPIVDGFNKALGVYKIEL